MPIEAKPEGYCLTISLSRRVLAGVVFVIPAHAGIHFRCPPDASSLLVFSACTTALMPPN